MVGIGSVSDVSRATAAYGATRQNDSQLRADLMVANNIITELWEDQQHTMARLRAMAVMFDFHVEENPTISRERWTIRPTIHHESTTDEHAEMEQPADDHSSQLFEDLNH